MEGKKGIFAADNEESECRQMSEEGSLENCSRQNILQYLLSQNAICGKNMEKLYTKYEDYSKQNRQNIPKIHL